MGPISADSPGERRAVGVKETARGLEGEGVDPSQKLSCGVDGRATFSWEPSEVIGGIGRSPHPRNSLNVRASSRGR
jgi:hypothetical protein